MNKLHPSAKWYFRIGAYLSFLFFGVVLGGFIIPILLLVELKVSIMIFVTFYLISIPVYIILVFIISEIYAQMSYNRYLYDLGKDVIKIERGIIWKKYTSIPYERIQNIDIHRGLIARMFGYSSIVIQTAGISGSVGAEGYIPAVDINDAEKIRKFIMKRTGKVHNSGL